MRILKTTVLTIALVTMAVYGSAQSGPIAVYSFEDAGNMGRDSASALDGSSINVTSIPGVRGLGARFQAGWIELPLSNQLRLMPGDFTLSVFVRIAPNSGNRNWFTKATTTTHYLGMGTPTPYTGRIGIGFEGNGAVGSAGSTTVVEDGEWHHVAGIKRGNTVEMWIDGQLEGSSPLSLTFSLDDSPAQFAIGRDGACCEYFNGDMDEAKIWKRALSPVEIAQEAISVVQPTLISSWTAGRSLPVADTSMKTFVRGNQVTVLTQYGETYTATSAADGSLGPWRQGATAPQGTYFGAVQVGDHVVLPGYPHSHIGSFAADGTVSEWHTGPGSTHAKGGPALTVVGNRIYSIGGAFGYDWFSDIETATIEANGTLSAWVQSASALPEGRMAAEAQVVGDQVYVLGGQSSGGGLGIGRDILRSQVGPTGELGPWTVVGLLREPRTNSALASVNGTLHLIGGGVHAAISASVESWHTSNLASTDGGLYSAPLPFALQGPASAVVNGRVYVLGGSKGAFGTNWTNEVWIGEVNSGNQSPIANAGSDQTIILGESATFDGSGSYDPDGSIVTYAWDFGDGTLASGATAIRTYSSAGIFTVTLTVTDNGNASGSDSATVTVLTQTQALQTLTATVKSFNLKQGISNSLDAKIQNAIDALSAVNAGARADAANKLSAFINAVEAQRNKQLTGSQADSLVALASRILTIL
jgi:hypothetical protein